MSAVSFFSLPGEIANYLISTQNTYLYIIAFVAPLVLMPLINLATIRSLWDLHNSMLQPSSHSIPPLNTHLQVHLAVRVHISFFVTPTIKPSFLVILGLSITGAFTQIVKITIGRPRPGRHSESPIHSFIYLYISLCYIDIISRCNPPAGLSDPLYGLTTSAICTQTDAGIMRDGFRSCFSGHSSCTSYFFFP